MLQLRPLPARRQLALYRSPDGVVHLEIDKTAENTLRIGRVAAPGGREWTRQSLQRYVRTVVTHFPFTYHCRSIPPK